MAEIKQWVNLPKNKGYADASGMQEEDLGERRLSVVLNKRMATTSGVLWPEGDLPYYQNEQDRNPRFRKPAPMWTPGYVNGMELSTETVALPAAGGEKYKVKVKYHLEEKTSVDTLVAWRMVFAQVYLMPGIASPDHVATLGRVATTLRDSFIEVKTIPQVNTRDRLSILSGNEALSLASTPPGVAKTVRDHLVRIIWAYYLPDEGEHEIEQELTSGPPLPRAACAIVGRTITLTLGKSVFIDLEDNERPFVHEATIVLRTGLLSSNVRIEVEATDIEAHNSSPGGAREDRKKLVLELSAPRYDALFDHLAGVPGKSFKGARLRLRLSAVEGFSGGWSVSRTGVIVVATMGHWVKAKDDRECILLHELGHFIGMVANGKVFAPIAPAHYYTGQGHKGPHCSVGVTPRTTGLLKRKTKWTGSPQCVMFGSTAAYDEADKRHASPVHFCDACKPVVKKLDLSAEGLKHVHET